MRTFNIGFQLNNKSDKLSRQKLKAQLSLQKNADDFAKSVINREFEY